MIPALQLRASAVAAPQPIVDPFYSNVGLLLHGNGSNGSTTFTDSGPDGRTATVNGAAQISTAQSVFGGASMLFDGIDDWITFPDDADFDFGAGDFTVEARIRLSGYSENFGGEYSGAICAKTASGTHGWMFYVSGTAASWASLKFWGVSSGGTSVVVTGNFAFSLNTWYAVRAVRSGNLVFLYVDGVLLNPGGTAFAHTINDNTLTLRVGSCRYDATFKYDFKGYIDELRITKGVPRSSTPGYTLDPVAFPNS